LTDVNGDSKLDVITVNDQLVGGVDVLTGDGTGTTYKLVPLSPFSMGAHPNHVVVADLDNDGKADLATANTGSGVASTVGIFLRKGDGKGGFGNAATQIQLAQVPTHITSADFNSDGCLDLAVAQANGGFSYLSGKGALVFDAPLTVAVNTQADSILAAPFNTKTDSLPDVVTPSGNTNNLSIVLNQCQ
jgi:hypothetical protein